MKKKGFTLIELLGVVIILGVLSLIAFPPLLNQIKNAKQGIKDSTKTLIIDAAKDYYEDNTNNFDLIEGMTYCIDIKTLTDENYLNKNLKNEKLNNIDTSKKVKLIYHNEKFNYDVVDSCTHYTVTFDANGGNVDIDSKEVIENSAYGTLPTPTREGYTFMGWNGKNMFDMEAWLNSCNSAYGGTFVKDNSSITLTATTSDAYTITYYVTRVGYGNINALKTPIKPNSNYTLSWKKNIDEEGQVFIFINDKDSIDGPAYQFSSNKLTTKRTVTTPSDAEYIRIRIDVANGKSVKFSNIQLEEGDTATEYEPYYITPDTKVTRNYDHTLKAIWKENE